MVTSHIIGCDCEVHGLATIPFAKNDIETAGAAVAVMELVVGDDRERNRNDKDAITWLDGV